jgi:hypothetical protein
MHYTHSNLGAVTFRYCDEKINACYSYKIMNMLPLKQEARSKKQEARSKKDKFFIININNEINSYSPHLF